MNIASGKIVSTEALLRWNHPEKGFIVPDKFIPLAEETGLILPIGEWVLKTACRQNKEWQSTLPSFKELSVSVNLSAKQFLQKDLAKLIEMELVESNLDPHYLIVY